MILSENAINILTAKTYRGIGKAWIIKNIRGNESIERIVMLLKQSTEENASLSISEFENKKQNIRKRLEQTIGISVGVIAIGDINFPPYRGIVRDSEKPIVLFYRGNLNLLDKQNKNVAVIGLLTPDEETEIIEKQIVNNLVNDGATIVSGLALGCDSIAHKEAILSGGKTVAILPSTISEILPQSNKGLAEEIVEHDGLLLSEYYEKINSKMELSNRYIERDRLQALFSDCVILSASYAENKLGNDCGSRHAMKFAKSYSIPRAVMYDSVVNINNPKYELNKQLIKEDDKIMVINNSNLQESMKKILSGSIKKTTENIIQKSLF